MAIRLQYKRLHAQYTKLRMQYRQVLDSLRRVSARSFWLRFLSKNDFLFQLGIPQIYLKSAYLSENFIR